MSFSQLVERTMKKNYTSTNHLFEFRAKIPAFHIYALAAYSVLALESSHFVDIKTFFSQSFFVKKWKKSRTVGVE